MRPGVIAVTLMDVSFRSCAVEWARPRMPHLVAL